LLSAWRQTIQKGREKLAKHLQSEEYLEFKHNFNLFLQVPEINHAAILQTDGTAAHVRDIVPVLVYSRYAAVRAYADLIPTASLPQLHALRIEYKKFRYTLEYFKEILGGGVNQLINEIKQLQDHLGELHDADVTCQLVRSFLKTWEETQVAQPIPVRANPEPIVRYLACLHSERYQLLISFPELWEKFSRAEYRQNLARAISSIS
jgi:CHAD domain-containing protein